MSETTPSPAPTSNVPPAEPATGPIPPIPTQQYAPQPGYAPSPPAHRASRVPLIAAWVGIVAGAVLIVAIIFGTGFMLGAHSGGGHRGGHDRGDAMERRDGPPQQVFPMGPMFRPGPGFVFPGGPGGFGPGAPGGSFGPSGPDGPGSSGQSPSTVPTPPR